MIPTRYISAGPLGAKASNAPAQAQAAAGNAIGNAISQVGEAGMEIAGRVRQIAESGKINAFLTQADQKAAEFSNNLMRRSDTEAWPQEWEDQSSALKQEAAKLGLSREGAAALDSQFSNWASTRAVHFETQAMTKSLGIARAQTSQSLDYFASRGDKEGFERTIKNADYLDPAEVQKANQHFQGVEAEMDLKRMVEGNPQGVIDHPTESYLERLPGATMEMVEQAKRKAEHQVEKYRGDEMDVLNGELESGNLKAADIEAATYLTQRDRKSLAGAMGQVKPPSNEDHGKAWEFLDTLRNARNDPSISPEQYRSLWNEGRASVLSAVAPQWQGDLKKELSYLSPAGRSAEPEQISRAVGASDLDAIGREKAFRAREAGVFGDTKDENFKKREAAYDAAEDIRLKVKQFVASRPSASVEDVRDYADSLIGVKIDGDSSLLPAVPPALDFGADIDRMLQLPPVSGRDARTSDALQLAPGAADASAALLPPLR